MLSDVLAEFVEIPIEEIERLLQMPQTTVYNDPYYQHLIYDLDVALLESSVLDARAAYDVSLDGFTKMLKREYGIPAPLTSYTLTDWFLNFVKSPEKMPSLINFNAMVPRHVLWDILPMMIGMLDQINDRHVRQEWQQAMATLMIPLTAMS